MILEKEINQKIFRNEYHKLAVNMYYTYSRFLLLQNNVFKRFGITAAQFNILRILRGIHPEPAGINYLKERMLDKMSDASRIVDKLYNKGLVARKVCKQDRRKAEVNISSKGMELLSQLDKAEDELDALFKSLSVTEARELNSFLDKLRG